MLVTLGCKEKNVTITKDYVINPNWNESENSFAVYRMMLKDSSQFIDLKDPSESELYHGLIKDTSFAYKANIKYTGESYTKRKVYFNRDNGFAWCNLNNMHSDCEQKIMGELQRNNWYLLALSQFKTLRYVYIDSLDSLHTYQVNTMTNY